MTTTRELTVLDKAVEHECGRAVGGEEDGHVPGVTTERRLRREPTNPRAVDWYETPRGVRVIIALGGEDLVVDEERARALHRSLAIALAEIDAVKPKRAL